MADGQQPGPTESDPADAAVGAPPAAGEGPATAEPVDDGTGMRALLDRSRERIAAEQARVNELIERYQDRPLLDVGLRLYQRDRDSVGTIVGSAVAFRLFLFFVPLTLFVVGVLGFLSQWIDAADVNDAAG